MTKRIVLIILSIVMISCMTDDQDIVKSFYVFPSPYSALTETATFRVRLGKSVASSRISVVVKDINNVKVWANTVQLTGINIDIFWAGENASGFTVSPGIYRATVSVSGTYNGEQTIEFTII